MYRAVLAVVVAIAALSACAAQPKQANSPSASGASKTQCHEVGDTGSLFSHTECTSSDDKQADQDDAQRNMKKAQMQPTPAPAVRGR